MKKLILTLIVLMTLSSAKTFAGGGSADTGGGNAVGAMLLDLYENKGTTVIEIKKLKAYKEVLEPILKEVDAKLPDFSKSLFAPSKDKKWLFDPKPLSRKQCLNSSIIETAKEVVGCQNNMEVRLSKKWYDSVDSTQQAALILHELLRGHALISDRIGDAEVAFLTRTIFEVDSHSAGELQEIFSKTGLGSYASAYDYGYVTIKAIAPAYKDVCVDKKEKPESLDHLMHGSLDGRYTSTQRQILYTFLYPTNDAWFWGKTEVACAMMKDMLDKY